MFPQSEPPSLLFVFLISVPLSLVNVKLDLSRSELGKLGEPRVNKEKNAQVSYKPAQKVCVSLIIFKDPKIQESKNME